MEKDIDLKDLTNSERIRQVLEDIKNGADRYIVKDDGQPQAVLLSLDDLALLKEAKANKKKAWDRLFKHLEQLYARNPGVSEEQVHADVEDAIRAVRQQAG